MRFTNEETESQKGDLPTVTELEDPRLEARPPAPNSVLPELPPAISDAWGFPARRLASGGREAALALRN